MTATECHRPNSAAVPVRRMPALQLRDFVRVTSSQSVGIWATPSAMRPRTQRPGNGFNGALARRMPSVKSSRIVACFAAAIDPINLSSSRWPHRPCPEPPQLRADKQEDGTGIGSVKKSIGLSWRDLSVSRTPSIGSKPETRLRQHTKNKLCAVAVDGSKSGILRCAKGRTQRRPR